MTEPLRDVPRVFISYAVRDGERVRQLERDLFDEGYDVRRDVRIRGGTDWWREICTWIREADVVLYGVSPTSVRSRYCLAELEYAAKTQRPIVPVTIFAADPHALPPEVRHLEIVDYRWHRSREGVALFRALQAVGTRELPDPLPPEPPVPVRPIDPLRQLVGERRLTEEQQDEIIRALEEIVRSGEDLAHDVITDLRRHDALVQANIPRVEAILESARDPTAPSAATRGLVKAIISASKKTDGLVPIVGSGVTDSLVGSRRQLARALAERHSFPMSRHLYDDLPQVAQFVSVNASRQTLYDDVQSELCALHAAAMVDAGDGDAAAAGRSVDELLIAAWDGRDPARPDPHALLAELPCPVYVTAQPSRLLEHALQAVDRHPETHVCRWNRDLRPSAWPASPFDDPDHLYVPSYERPLVFHAFGVLDQPDTLVLTEDDYFTFLIAVASNYRLIPEAVQGALASGMLLVVGFRLEDWDFRTLWRALTTADGVGQGSDKHVAAQVDLTDSAVSPDDARVYLEKYFGPRSRKSEPPLDIFWGSVADLAASVIFERSAAG